MHIAETLHEIVPYLPVAWVALAFALYSVLFRLIVRRSGGDPQELGLLIVISFALLAIPMGYVIWKGWFRDVPVY